MLILIFSIFSIVSGFNIELDVPLKFDLPKWMNNDSLTSFFTKANESSSSNCVIFKQKDIGSGNIAYTSNCIKDSCRMPAVVPPTFCPISGSLNRIDFYLDNITQAIYIVAKGCYLQDKDKKIDGDWYLSNKNTIDLEGFSELKNDSVDVSSLNSMKCSELCNAYDCYGSFKIVFRLAFHTEERDSTKYKNLLITSVGAGILFFVILIVIFVFVKNLNK